MRILLKSRTQTLSDDRGSACFWPNTIAIVFKASSWFQRVAQIHKPSLVCPGKHLCSIVCVCVCFSQPEECRHVQNTFCLIWTGRVIMGPWGDRWKRVGIFYHLKKQTKTKIKQGTFPGTCSTGKGSILCKTKIVFWQFVVWLWNWWGTSRSSHCRLFTAATNQTLNLDWTQHNSQTHTASTESAESSIKAFSWSNTKQQQLCRCVRKMRKAEARVNWLKILFPSQSNDKNLVTWANTPATYQSTLAHTHTLQKDGKRKHKQCTWIQALWKDTTDALWVCSLFVHFTQSPFFR